MKHSIQSLPKWAQQELHKRDQEIKRLQSLEAAYDILESHTWHTLSPLKGAFDTGDYRRLYLIDKDMFTTVCSIGINDILLIGRGKKEAE